MRGLHGRRVILTGGASGIGRAAALRLAAEGCVLGIFDLDEAGAQATARAVSTGAAYRVDITDRDSRRAVAVVRGDVRAGKGWPMSRAGTPRSHSWIPTARCGTR